mmetsp:Transcript_4313/g.11108  ORF Transcript_4313/g.11108 Transcript_4313/m.11108 type:complete len:238 (-) Transcript_4313:606-1319(-)
MVEVLVLVVGAQVPVGARHAEPGGATHAEEGAGGEGPREALVQVGGERARRDRGVVHERAARLFDQGEERVYPSIALLRDDKEVDAGAEGDDPVGELRVVPARLDPVKALLAALLLAVAGRRRAIDGLEGPDADRREVSEDGNEAEGAKGLRLKGLEQPVYRGPKRQPPPGGPPREGGGGGGQHLYGVFDAPAVLRNLDEHAVDREDLLEGHLDLPVAADANRVAVGEVPPHVPHGD